jgi:ribose 5-phosphate isomerase B
MKETLAIACDHGGYELKEAIKARLSARFDFLDLGTHSAESVDYPAYGRAIAEAVANGKAKRGIAICGSGIGISIAANRNPKIRAALCTDITMARLARQHNDANILALGARILTQDKAFEIIDAFLETEFEGGRHEKRVAQLCSTDKRKD